MKNKINYLIITLSVLLTAISVFAAKPSAKVKFWNSFRDSFLKEDFKNLEVMTKFPVEVKGAEDADPKFSVKKDHFKSCLALIYPRDIGMGKFDKTHKDYINELKDLPETEGGKNQFRIGDLVFEKNLGKFKLVRFYLDTSEENVKTNCQ